MQTYNYQVRADGVDVVLVSNNECIVETCLLFASNELGGDK